MAISLTTLQIFQGSFTLAFVVISFVLGIKIMLKYRKFKRRQLLLVGITWIFLVSPYWPDAISFLMIVFLNTQLDKAVYFFIANGFIAPLHITWMVVFTDFLYQNKQKLILFIFALEAVFFESLFLVLYLQDLNFIGTQISYFYVRWNPIIINYLLISIVLLLATGILFARESLKSENKEIRLKGKFLLGAFIAFTIGTLLDSAFDLTEVPAGAGELIVVLARSFVIIAAFAFYIGFTLPDIVKKALIQE